MDKQLKTALQNKHKSRARLDAAIAGRKENEYKKEMEALQNKDDLTEYEVLQLSLYNCFNSLRR